MIRQRKKEYVIWAGAFLLLALYIFSLYQRGNGWRWAPALHIVVMSEPLEYMTQAIAGEYADVQGLPYPLTGTGERLRAERLLSEAHIIIVPKAEDALGLPVPEHARVVDMEEAFSRTFQYPLLENNRQFFAYALPEMEERILLAIRDRLVDMDVVRAGKYEVATKALRNRIKKEGTIAPQQELLLPFTSEEGQE